jgi:TRAP-type transport system small permease protein
MLAIFSRMEAGLAWIVRAGLVIFMIIVFVFTIGSASDRYIYNTAFNAHAEIAGIALAWVTFLGFMLAYRSRTNIRVDIFDGLAPARLILVRDLAGDLIALATFCIIQWRIWRLISVGGGQYVAGTPFSLAVIYYALAVASGYGIVLIVLRLAFLVTGRGAYPKEDG